MTSERWTYERAGVILSRHRAMHEVAHEVIRRVSREVGLEIHGLDEFAQYIRMGGLDVCLHADGVGTKAIIAQMLNKLDVIGWDAVAMNVNDISVAGFRPLALSVYIALPSSDVSTFEMIMRGVEEAAKYSKTVVVSGETAIMPDLLNYVDVCCFAVGVRAARVERASVGDVIIGLESSGLHANGYTLARKVLLSRYKLSDHISEIGTTLGEELTKRTLIYSNLMIKLYESSLIKCAAHITGGAFTKIKRVLSENASAHIIPPEPKPIFKLIQRAGNIDYEEMYRVFNMGIGAVVFTRRELVDDVMRVIRDHGIRAHVVGEVVRGKREVVIEVEGKVIKY